MCANQYVNPVTELLSQLGVIEIFWRRIPVVGSSHVVSPCRSIQKHRLIPSHSEPAPNFTSNLTSVFRHKSIIAGIAQNQHIRRETKSFPQDFSSPRGLSKEVVPILFRFSLHKLTVSKRQILRRYVIPDLLERGPMPRLNVDLVGVLTEKVRKVVVID